MSKGWKTFASLVAVDSCYLRLLLAVNAADSDRNGIGRKKGAFQVGMESEQNSRSVTHEETAQLLVKPRRMGNQHRVRVQLDAAKCGKKLGGPNG